MFLIPFSSFEKGKRNLWRVSPISRKKEKLILCSQVLRGEVVMLVSNSSYGQVFVKPMGERRALLGKKYSVNTV